MAIDGCLECICGKEPSILSLSPMSFLSSAIRSVGMGSPSSSPPVDSSKISGCSPTGSSNTQLLKKREGWVFEVVGVFGRNIPKLSLFLQGTKEVFFLSFMFFFQALRLTAELKSQTEWKLIAWMKSHLQNGKERKLSYNYLFINEANSRMS